MASVGDGGDAEPARSRHQSALLRELTSTLAVRAHRLRLQHKAQALQDAAAQGQGGDANK